MLWRTKRVFVSQEATPTGKIKLPSLLFLLGCSGRDSVGKDQVALIDTLKPHTEKKPHCSLNQEKLWFHRNLSVLGNSRWGSSTHSSEECLHEHKASHTLLTFPETSVWELTSRYCRGSRGLELSTDTLLAHRSDWDPLSFTKLSFNRAKL